MNDCRRWAGRSGVMAGAASIGVLSSCSAPMSTLNTASLEGGRLAEIGWILIIISVVVWVVTMILMLVAAGRRTRDASEGGGAEHQGGAGDDVADLTEHSIKPVVIAGAIIPGLILVVVFVASLAALRRSPTPAAHPITFNVTGHQWWWDVEYVRATDSVGFRTANEIHVPVGQTVRLILRSVDVIHSFWVPQLQGKMDLIPGNTNELRFTATKPGIYRGQCAEYCGLQHAHMAFIVVAESPAQFQAWLRDEQQRAVPASDSSTARGEDLVVHGICATCHTIRGTSATGTLGPDLTHIGSRLTLAAGALPNDLGTMEAWITGAQTLKPGALMPSLPRFTGAELRAMATYLESLR